MSPFVGAKGSPDPFRFRASYSRLKPGLSQATIRYPIEDTEPLGYGLKTTAKKSPQLLKGFPHIPFDEFPLKKSEDLVVVLEKNMPEGAKVEVTPMDDSHHSPCMQEMVAIMVHNIEEGKQTSDIFTIYQFCPSCHVAVRVL